MSVYVQILTRQIKAKTKTKEEITKNVALWQAYGLITDTEFMDLMTLIEQTYLEVVDK